MVVLLKLFLGCYFVWILGLAFPNSVTGTVARYDSYRLYELTPTVEKHLQLLNDIDFNSDSYTFLVGPRTVNSSVVVIVPPHKFADFDLMLNMENVTHRIVSSNVQSMIDDESFIQSRISDTFGWNKYHQLDSIHNWMDSILEQYPNVTSSIFVGKSYENRDIRGVKISFKTGNPGVLIEGGIHAREWISSAVTTFLMNSLLSSKNESIRSIAENFDWYIFPNVNPDGYVYTHTSNRLWRKTRTPYGGNCFGADPNRNFDFHFSRFGASRNPCSEVYAGPKAFSEIEMKSYSNYLRSIQHKIHTYIAFHSYSQLLLFPYGHTPEKVKNFDDLMEIGQAAVKALARRYNTQYRVGNIYNTIYPASGASVDWIYGVLSVPLSYTYELRPASSYNGFELPVNQIIPTCLETIDSIVALLSHAKSLGYYNLQKEAQLEVR